MLFSPTILTAVAEGRVDLAFRRWRQPRVRPGGRQRTGIGVIAFDAVEAIDRDDLTDEEARRAGYPSRSELLAFVDRRSEGTIYRIRVHLLGPDPRVALRASSPDDDELREIERRLAQLDRSSRHGAWTRALLETIGERPSVPAIELAAAFGREKRPFKADVRKLKELGLTESLRQGYRLSPRGQAVLSHMGRAAKRRRRIAARSPA